MTGNTPSDRKTFDISIKLKAMSFLSILMLGLIGILTTIHLTEQKKMLEGELQTRISIMKENLVERGRMFITSLAGQIENEIAAYNFSGVMETIKNAVLTNQDIKYAVLVDTTGQIFVHTRQPELVQKRVFKKSQLQSVQQMRIIETEYPEGDDSVIQIAAPLQISTSPWGEVRLIYTTRYLEKEIDRSRLKIRNQIHQLIKNTILMSIGLMLAIIAIVYVMVSKLLSPIIDLTRFARQLSYGDFSTSDHINIRSRDEVGMLAATFMDMKNELRLSYAKLTESNRTLEHKVRERTEELHQKNRELNKASQTKSQFIANISHEIKTPMTAIIGMTDLLLQMDLPYKIREKLTTIKKSADILMDMISGILDFSKIEAGKIKMEKVLFRLDDLINSLLDTLLIKLDKKDVDLILYTEEDVPAFLIGDPLRFSQILFNLIGNAIKFTDTGEIFIHIRLQSRISDQAELNVSVRDTGIGIAPEQIPELFQSFTQADGSTTRKYGGTGLGLTISRQLVVLMSGELSAESQPGSGSTFRFNAFFDLPEQLPLPSCLDRPQKVKAYRILVIEPNQTYRNLFHRHLSQVGYTVDVIDSGEAALHTLRNSPFPAEWDVILIDGKIAETLNHEMVQLFLEMRYITPTVLMVMINTGQGETDIRFGFEDCLIEKPIKWSRLDSQIQSFLQNRPSGEPDTAATGQNRSPGDDAPKKIDTAEALVFLERLSDLIAENNIKTKQHLEQIWPNLQGLGVSTHLNNLAGQVARFDFKNARLTVNQIKKTLTMIHKEAMHD